MQRKFRSSTLLIVIIGIGLITFTACGNSNTVAGSNEKDSVFKQGEAYVITGEFDNHSQGGIGYGDLLVEVLEVNDKWIRVEIIDDNYVKTDLKAERVKRAKEEGYIKDIWINTEKIHYIMTEPDVSNFSN